MFHHCHSYFLKFVYKDYERTKNDVEIRFLRYREGAVAYGMSQSSFEKLAKEAGAVFKVGKMALVKVDILDAYLERFHV